MCNVYILFRVTNGLNGSIESTEQANIQESVWSEPYISYWPIFLLKAHVQGDAAVLSGGHSHYSTGCE